METLVSRSRIARTAGLLYLIVVVAGFFSLIYVPSHITVEADAAATVRNIMAHESLFRFGIVAGLIGFTAFVVLPLALYKLLSPVDRTAAVLMVALAVVSVPMAFVAFGNRLDALTLLNDVSYARVFPADQLNARVMLSLDAYHNAMFVSEIFWGLWLLPLGYLVFKSGFLPRILGILLMIGCFGYLIQFVGAALFPGPTATAISSYVGLPGAVGEIGICLWLLIIGVRERRPSDRAPIL